MKHVTTQEEALVLGELRKAPEGISPLWFSHHVGKIMQDLQERGLVETRMEPMGGFRWHLRPEVRYGR
jgi:DNA-binding IscR family transcriptional regulator